MELQTPTVYKVNKEVPERRPVGESLERVGTKQAAAKSLVRQRTSGVARAIAAAP